MRSDLVFDGRYRLVDRLGVGGMSEVWRARDEVLDRDVAVKVLAAPEATHPAARERIKAEAQAVARLWHPHITHVFDYGEATGETGEPVPYVVMELLPGQSLAQRLTTGPLPPREAFRVCAEVADALAAAHAQNVVHRDVKPENVVLTPAGAKVVDFGIAAVAGPADVGNPSDGEVLGTPAYLAPERLSSDDVLPASDVYALGVLLYLTLTNELPWQAQTTTQLIRAHAYYRPAPLPALAGVREPIRQLIEECLAKSPDARPSAAEVAAVLTAAVHSTDPDSDTEPAGTASLAEVSASTVALARSTVVSTRRRHAALLAAAAAATAAIAAIVIVTDSSDPLIGTSANAATDAGVTTTSTPAGVPGTTTPTSTGAATAGPSATPAPSRTAAPTTRKPPPTVARPRPQTPHVITALGGVLTVVCVGDTAAATGLVATAGYTVTTYRPGPDNEVRAILRSATHQSEIRAKCDDGVPVTRVKEASAKD